MALPLRAYWDLLSRHIRPQRGRFVLLCALMLAVTGLQVLNPQILRQFIDAALGGDGSGLAFAALAFIAIALTQQAVSVVVAYLGEKVAWTSTNALRAELASHVLNLDTSFHSEVSPGELIERIDGDVTEMARFFSQFVVILGGNLLLMIGILAALFREDWRAGVVFALFALVGVVTLNRTREIAMAHQKGRRQAEANLFGFVEEQLTGTEDIRASGGESFSLRELTRLQADVLHHDLKANFKRFQLGLVMGVLLAVGNILAITSGYFLYLGGAITVGTVYLFVHYINQLQQPLWTLTHEMESFQTIGACVQRLNELRQVQSKLQDGPDTSLPGGALALSFEQVSFAYSANGNGKHEAATSVLRGLSFHLEGGKVLGLLGRTGSGKTTLARLVLRLFDPAMGRVLLNGKDIREARLQALRSKVAIVTQDVQLFQGSLRDNLTFFNRSIHDEQIRFALRELGLDEWLDSLPEGLDTPVEARGRNLSAGEAQLLAFTRVFLRDPGLVILDEASSRLDPATEQRIEHAVDRLLKGRTAIIIAHRLGTLHRADEVMILEDGQACEHGDRTQLAADPDSRYSRLLQAGMEEVLA